MDAFHVDEDDKHETVSVSGLSVLAEAAMSVLSHGKESSEPAHDENLTSMIPLKDFKTYLINQPDATVEGIYGKSIEFLGKHNAVVLAPGCDEKARMVESRRYKERPHLVTPGKQKGEYRCEKNCPHFNGIRICSHTVVTAQQNGELLDFLNHYKQSCAKKGINLSLTVRKDMPKHPGRKGGVPSTARRSSPKLAVNERVKRLYPQSSIPNINPFRLKQMCFRIKVCQGYRGPLQSSLGTVTDAPFDFCVVRKERRTYKDPQTRELCTRPLGNRAVICAVFAGHPRRIAFHRVPQKLHYKRVRSESLLDLINVIFYYYFFSCFCALFDRFIQLLKFNFISDLTKDKNESQHKKI